MATDPGTILDPPADPNAGTPPPNDPPADPNAGNPPADPNAGDPPAGDPPSDDWRTRLAGEDGKLLGFLGRYTSEKAFVEAAKKDRESARSALKPLSDDPSEDELAAYRKNFSVPDKPEGYLEKLPEGLVVGEDDRPVVDEFLAAMHATHAPAGVTAAAIDAYYKIVEKQEADISTRIATAKAETEDTLRGEWGGDYRRNVNITQSFLETLPEGVQEAISGGFDDKGIPLGNNTEVLKWLAALALDANPVATVVPGAGANQASAIADEIANLEKMMGDTSSDYWKGPKSAQLQARYIQLVEAKGKLG